MEERLAAAQAAPTESAEQFSEKPIVEDPEQTGKGKIDLVLLEAREQLAGKP